MNFYSFFILVNDTHAELHNTFFNSPMIVTKNGESDDANGCNIEGQNHLWLKVCRVGRAFSFHYSLDVEKFYMTRYFLMPESKAVKVGLLAQAPTGNGGA